MNIIILTFKFFTGSFFWILEFINCTLNYCLFPALRTKLTNLKDEEILNGPDIKRYCQVTAFNFGLKFKIINPSNIDLTKQFIFIANHSSWFDQPALKTVADNPCHFLAKEDYLKIPVLKWGLQVHQTIFVKRTNNEEANELCEKYLKLGHSLCLYPEGTRTLGEQIKNFKSGAFKHASKNKVQILPIFIENSDLVLIKSDPLWKINRGITINLHVGKPVTIPAGQEEQFKMEMENKYRAYYNKIKHPTHLDTNLEWT